MKVKYPRGFTYLKKGKSSFSNSIQNDFSRKLIQSTTLDWKFSWQRQPDTGVLLSLAAMQTYM